MSLSRTAASLAAAIVFAVCPAARAGGLRFQRPNVIPEPTSLRYSADVACRLDGASEVRVIAKDEASAEWVRGKLASFLHVAPRVVFVPKSSAGGAAGGYRLEARPPSSFTLDGESVEGVRNAFYTLRMCLMPERGVAAHEAWICPELEVADAPAHRFRAMHVCWMPETRAALVERQLRLAAYFKFNHLLIEFWGTYGSAACPWYGWPDCRVPTAELRRLVALGRDLGVTLVPVLNCLGHATLSRRCGGKHAALDLDPSRQSLFEPREGWVWCLTNPETKRVINTLVSEMYEAFGRPGYFHIGCDEADAPSCPVCAATDWPATVAAHIKETSGHIASLGARTLMWHDMLISRDDDRWGGEAMRRYPVNGASRDGCERMLAMLPKDVVICDWYYGKPLESYPTWAYFRELGFDVVPCAWQNADGTKAMGEACARAGTFGFMGTTWHHAYNEDIYCCYLPAAEAAWGSSVRAQTASWDFASRWRQVGWDMGVSRREDCGYAENEIPLHTSTPH